MVGFAATGELRYSDFLFHGVSHITVDEAIIANDDTADDVDVDTEPGE